MYKTLRKKTPKYSHNISRIYLNATTAILSTTLALILLREKPLLLSYYVAFTFILTMIASVLKIRFASVRPTPQEGLSPDVEEAPKKRLIALLFLIIFAGLALPFLLAGFLPPHVWFILIVGLATGLSISEITFYIYCRKIVSRNV